MFHSRCSWRPTSGVNQYNAQWVIPLLDKYLFLSLLFSQIQAVWACFLFNIDLHSQNSILFCYLVLKKPFFSTHLLESLSAMIWPSFRAVSSAACLSASACFNLHTQTKAGDTNMQNKKKKTIKTNYDKNICLLYMCTSLYSRWNRTYWNIKMDKRTWFLKYNNLWKIKKFTIFGLRIDLKFLITTWKNFENLSSSQTHYFHISSWCFD